MQKNKSLLNSDGKDISYYTLAGLHECELEDMINPVFYKDYIQEKTGIDITTCPEFCNSNKKWSIRIKESLQSKGKIYEEDEFATMLDDYKKYIYKIDNNINNIIISNRTPSIKSFSEQIENYFNTNKDTAHD